MHEKVAITVTITARHYLLAGISFVHEDLLPVTQPQNAVLHVRFDSKKVMQQVFFVTMSRLVLEDSIV